MIQIYNNRLVEIYTLKYNKHNYHHILFYRIYVKGMQNLWTFHAGNVWAKLMRFCGTSTNLLWFLGDRLKQSELS